jgi:hypothetical protein
MQSTCPNCDHEIALVGAKELAADYGFSTNAIQYAREKGRFPEPWLRFGNRFIYLRDEMELHLSKRGNEEVDRAIERVVKALDALPERERQAARSSLVEELRA